MTIGNPLQFECARCGRRTEHLTCAICDLRALGRVLVAVTLAGLMLWSLTGCAELGAATREKASNAVREVNEQSTLTALQWLCFGQSRRELLQRFNEPVKAQALATICGDDLEPAATGARQMPFNVPPPAQ